MSEKRCKIKRKILVDVRVEADFPQLFRWRFRDFTVDERAKELEKACEEFAEFIRDHRSQDPVELTVVRVHQDLCSNCLCEWEQYEEEGKIYCAGCGAVVTESEVKG